MLLLTWLGDATLSGSSPDPTSQLFDGSWFATMFSATIVEKTVKMRLSKLVDGV